MVKSHLYAFSQLSHYNEKQMLINLQSDTQDVSILLSEKYFQIHIWYKFNKTNIVRFSKISYKNTELNFEVTQFISEYSA